MYSYIKISIYFVLNHLSLSAELNEFIKFKIFLFLKSLINHTLSKLRSNY